MKRCLLATALLFTAFPVLAQVESAQLRIPNFDHLRQYAKDSVNITLSSWPLGIAAWVIDDNDPEQAELKALLRGLKAVHVRKFEFDTDFVYSEQDIEAVRSQLTAPGWSRLIEVRNRKDNESVDVYVALDGNQANGLAIVASEPRKFTILNIVGRFDLDKLGKLEDRLGLPRLGVESDAIARSE